MKTAIPAFPLSLNLPAPRLIQTLLAGGSLVAALLFTGCVSAPPSYRLRPDAATKTAAHRTIAIAPLDTEVREISAGGVAEIRDEWSVLVGRNLTKALTDQTGYKPVEALAPDHQAELTETAALLRAITLNHSLAFFNPQLNRGGPRPLSYHLGPVDRLAVA
jgi:hypothetical protein